MNVYNFLFVFSIGLSAVAGSSPAEELRPKEPLLPALPSGASWEIDFSYSQKNRRELSGQVSQAEGHQISKTEIAKSGNLYREIVSFSGKKAETWICGEIAISNLFSTVPVQVEMTTPDISSFKRGDFDDVSWITMDHYKGIVSLVGRKVFLFSARGKDRELSHREELMVRNWEFLSNISGAKTSKPSFLDGESRVYLDTVTGMPVAFDNGEMTGTYTFHPTGGTSTVKMPEDFQRELQTIVATLRAYGVDTETLLKHQ